MGTIFYFSSRPNPLGFLPSSRHTSGIDKLAHVGEYAGLAALLHRALREQGGKGAGEKGSTGDKERGRRGEGEKSPPHLVTSSPPHLSFVALIAFAYAVLDEFHQELAPGREFELADIGYDLAGIIAALGLIWIRDRQP
jgi:VanZ family protein